MKIICLVNFFKNGSKNTGEFYVFFGFLDSA